MLLWCNLNLIEMLQKFLILNFLHNKSFRHMIRATAIGYISRVLADQAQPLWVINPLVAKLRILCACGQSTAIFHCPPFCKIFFSFQLTQENCKFLYQSSQSTFFRLLNFSKKSKCAGWRIFAQKQNGKDFHCW